MSVLLSTLLILLAIAASWSLLVGSDPWRRWRLFAAERDLSVVVPMPDGDPQMSGVWRGVRVRVICRQERSGLPPETHFSALLPPGLPAALTVRRRQPGSDAAPGSVRCGDRELDDRLVFRSGQPALLLDLLADDAVRTELLALSVAHPDALLEDGALRFSLPGRVTDAQALEAGLDDLAAPLTAMRAAAGLDVVATAVPAPGGPATVDGTLLARLVASELAEPERRVLLEALGGDLQVFEVMAERVGRTSALLLSEPYRGGRTLFATSAQAHLQLAVRFPASRDGELDDIRPGERLKVRARIVGWDALTRRLNLEAP